VGVVRGWGLTMAVGLGGRFFRIVGLLVAVGGSAGTATGAECERATLNGPVDWYPVIKRSATKDRVEGVLPGLAEAAFGRMGIAVSYAPVTPYKRQLHQLQTGQLDLVLGAFWTSERAAQFNYTVPLITEEVAVFVREGEEFPLESWADLKGRLGIRHHGGSLGEDFDVYASENLTIEFELPQSGSSLLHLLGNNDVDYVIQGRRQGWRIIEAHGLEDIVDLSWPILSNPVYAMFSRSSPCAAHFEKFNQELKHLLANGQGASGRAAGFSGN